MKNAIKYLVLSISCVICFVALVLMVGLLCDIKDLSHPTTLILPMISFTLLIGGFVMLTIWAFKFSNNKDHKTILIISLSVFLASVVVFISARIISPIISEKKDVYFDFTTTEIIEDLKICSIGVKPITVVDADTHNIKTYTSKDDIYTTDNEGNFALMHYSICCNKETDKVQSVSYFIDKNSVRATERFFYHLFSVVNSIDPTVNTKDLTKAIISDSTEIDGAYIGNRFMVNVYCLGNDYHAYIMPNENTKGD